MLSHRFAKAFLLAVFLVWMPLSPVMAAALHDDEVAPSAVAHADGPESTTTSVAAEDLAFLSYHQEEGANLAGGEINLTESEMLIIVLGVVVAVLLIVAIA